MRLGIARLGRAQSISRPPGDATARGELRLAGMSLAELRQRLYDQLFQVLLPFWDKHGIDHEFGGLMCSLDYDGTLLDTGKNLWFLGRAIWVYSFLYNHFGNNPLYLEVAKRTKEFAFKYARQKDGWWAEGFTGTNGWGNSAGNGAQDNRPEPSEQFFRTDKRFQRGPIDAHLGSVALESFQLQLNAWAAEG